MTESHTPEIDEQTLALLEDYLDDRLAPDLRAGFEARLAAEPGLQEELDLQQRIDGVLEGFGSHGAERERQILAQITAQVGAQPSPERMTPAPMPVEAAAVAAERSRWRFPRSPVIRIAAMVAVAALIGVGTWLVIQPPGGPTTPYQEIQVVQVQQVYQDTIDQGFEPDWVCDEQRFTQTLDETLGSSLALLSMPDDRHMLGLSYVARGRTNTVYMLGKSKGQPVLVFFDRVNLIEPTYYNLDLPNGVYLHRRTLGNIEAIEVSGDSVPAFLDFLQAESLEEG